MFLGEDLIAWLLLALGGALCIGNLLALVRPPTPPAGSVEALTDGPPPRPPLFRSLFYAVLGFIASVWSLATLISGSFTMASKPLQLKFVQSATRVHQLPELGPEVAFVGRSNVGKSSLINALAHQRQLARVSNTPGRTQLINVFSHVAGGAVVDLPGYGYAKVPGHIRGDWSSMIEGYLLEREELV
ncbi:MAG: ribosome biogenesis GTP-binding protein YihA/YsxC, partial [Actinomycetota bacterium]|nr:ribosome biogenesis GTP-binding protein YihA/YsxC [Actinomycetota bacterium]